MLCLLRANWSLLAVCSRMGTSASGRLLPIAIDALLADHALASRNSAEYT